MANIRAVLGAAFAAFAMLALPMVAMAAGQGGPSTDPPMVGDPAMERAQECGMFGTVTENGTEYAGAYVSFEMSEGVITDYAVGGDGTLLLEKFEVAEFGYVGASAEGAVVKIDGSAGRIMAHNNRPAVLHFSKTCDEPATLSVEFADGFSVAKLAGCENLEISGAVDALALVENGTAAIDGTTVTVTYGSVCGSFTLRVDPATGEGLMAQAQSMARNGGLAGEMDAVAAQGTSASVCQCYNWSARMSLQAAGNGTLRVRVEAEFQHGMAFRIGTDYETVGAKNAAGVRARLDGEKMRRVSAGELYQYQEQNRSEAAYCVESHGMGCDVLVYVPHFSEHEITIEGVETPAVPVLPVAAAAVAAVAVVGYVAFRARRRP